MSEWIKAPIESLLESSFAGEWGAEPRGKVSNTIVFRGADFNASGRLSASAGVPRSIPLEKLKKIALRPGDILLEKSGGSPDQPVGRVSFFQAMHGPAASSNFLQTLRPRKDVDAEFLFYLLQYEYRTGRVLPFQQQTTGIINFRLRDYLKEIVNLPSDSREQRRIAEVLSALDEQIEQTEAVVVKLMLARSGLYANLRESFPPAVRIGEQFSLSSGTTPLRSKTHFYGQYGTPWVKTLDLNESRLSQTDESVTNSALAACSLRLLPPGTILVAMYGGWEQIGRTALLDIEACTNQAITAISAKNASDWNPYFVLKALQALRHKWRDFAVSTRKDPNITKSDIAEFMLPMPSVAEQNYWAGSLESADEQILMYKAEASKLRLQKHGLMHDLLTGATPIR